MFKIINDPIKCLLDTVNKMYPEVDCEIQYDDSMNMYEDEFGCTIFPDDGSKPYIVLNPELNIGNLVEIIAHEVAHVIAGKEAEHNDKWQIIFDEIYNAFQEDFTNLFLEYKENN